MYDMSVPNAKPGECAKCRGTGVYSWGASINGKMQHSGKCNSCGGSGKQSQSDIRRNVAYNRHKLNRLFGGDL
jgi:DnaJ-class molecular chaperone